MRLTADLINGSLTYLNPLKERELDLRGHRIPAIENLGVAKDFDALDLTDNDIPSLSNFPLSARLQTVLAARNRISSIQPTLHQNIPNLTTLVLFDNRMQELADLDPLGSFGKLVHLVLMENPVCKKEHYRSWVLWRCPSVRFLDYTKVKLDERTRAAELFGSADAPTALAAKILNIKSRTFDPSNVDTSSTADDRNISRIQLTPEEKERMKKLLKNAKTMQDIQRLEKVLSDGKIPGTLLEDAMVLG